mmetsp:Transcript_9764/g.20850  ORF Transcript_9764/g.20850 Transcript_9764/m.20850 type:complete len:202 (-) Transcript_9764:1138-1743(-)
MRLRRKTPRALSSMTRPDAAPSRMELPSRRGVACPPTYTLARSLLRMVLRRYSPPAFAMMTRPRAGESARRLSSMMGAASSRTARLAPSLAVMRFWRMVGQLLPRTSTPPARPREMWLPTSSAADWSSMTMFPLAWPEILLLRYTPRSVCRSSSPICRPSAMTLFSKRGVAESDTATLAKAFRSMTLFWKVPLAVSWIHMP